MGYYSRVRGYIEFTPSIKIENLREHPVLSKYGPGEEAGFYPDLEITSVDYQVYDRIECVTTDSFKAYDVQDNLEEIVAALQDRTFSGRIELYGEEEGDIYGYRIKNGIVEQIEPKLVWPED